MIVDKLVIIRLVGGFSLFLLPTSVDSSKESTPAIPSDRLVPVSTCAAFVNVSRRGLSSSLGSIRTHQMPIPPFSWNVGGVGWVGGGGSTRTFRPSCGAILFSLTAPSGMVWARRRSSSPVHRTRKSYTRIPSLPTPHMRQECRIEGDIIWDVQIPQESQGVRTSAQMLLTIHRPKRNVLTIDCIRQCPS